MKKVLQQTLFRLKTFLLLAVMFVVGGSAAWAQDWQVVTENPMTANSGFTIIDANGDGKTWRVDNGNYIQYSWHDTNAANDYCVLAGEELTAGATYRVSFEVKHNGMQEYFDVVYGTSANAASLTNTIISNTKPTAAWATYSNTFTVPVSGTYYIAIHATSPANQYNLYARNYKLEVDAESLVDDGSVKSTFNFNQASVPFVNAAGVAGNLQGGNRPSIGDVFTAPSGGATLTFNYVGESWSNSAQRLRLDSNASFTIAAPEGFEMTKIVFTTDINTMTFTSKSGLTGNGSAKATWEGQSESETFTISALSFIQNIKVTMVPVAEEGEITYTIDLVDAPVGAYVTLDGQTFNSDDTYTIEKNFGKNDLEVYVPEGYYAEVEYTRDNHTYTVTYKAYNYYDVTVTGTTDPAAGVVYNEQTYGNGSRIESKDVLTESSVSAVVVDGLSGSVSLAGNTFKVAYKKPAYVEFVLGGEVSAEKAGVTFSLSNSFMNQGDYGLDVWKSSWYFTIHSSQFDIEKIELFNSYDSSMTGLGSTPSGFSSSNNTWTGNARSVEFKGLSTFTSDYYIVKARVYLVGYDGNEEEKERECVMDVASTFFSTGNVEQINSNLTFVADVNTEGDHSGGAVPDGVTLVDDNATNYTISSMLWWDKDSQVVLNLPSAITAPGHYTLTIPEGVIPCVGNKANKEIVFEWTIAEPTTYTVTFADGAPAGASVTIDGNTYTENTTFPSRNNLDENSANVKDVEGYEGSVAYDSENKEFTITYTALPVIEYTVSITPADFTININGNETGVGSYVCYAELTEESIEAPKHDGYYDAPSVVLNNTNHTITVVYTALPTLAIGTSASDKDGNYWTTFSFNRPVSFSADVTPCIVTDAENGTLIVEEIVAQDNEYTYDLDFTTGAYSSSTFTAMDGKLTVAGVNWIFNTGYGYAETANTEDWTTITFTLADDFDGVIKSIRFLTATDTNSAWFSYTDGYMNNWSEIPVNGKTMEIGAWYDQMIKHFYLDIVEPGDVPVIPANTGILVKSNESKDNIAYTVHEAGEENVDVTSNLLVAGCDPEAVWDDANKLFYKLSWKNSSYEDLGFYWGVEGGHSITPSQNKAYLVLDAPAGAESNRAFVFGGYEEVLTGIDSVSAVSDAPIFNLQGKRVSRENLSAGVYVQDGKKFIVK